MASQSFPWNRWKVDGKSRYFTSLGYTFRSDQCRILINSPSLLSFPPISAWARTRLANINHDNIIYMLIPRAACAFARTQCGSRGYLTGCNYVLRHWRRSFRHYRFINQIPVNKFTKYEFNPLAIISHYSSDSNIFLRFLLSLSEFEHYKFNLVNLSEKEFYEKKRFDRLGYYVIVLSW